MMRKRIIDENSKELSAEQTWLDLERIASVEVTSEEAGYPIESALIPGGTTGWLAGKAGEQKIRLLFDEPVVLERVHLVFEEKGRQRTHQFLLTWSEQVGGPHREIVRQQYTFAPPDTTVEVENYRVNLSGVRLLELRIIPDISGTDARASLTSMRLA